MWPENLDLPALLRRWNEELLAHSVAVVAAELGDGVTWVGRPPASEADISAVEARLGVHLPPSYREFLRVSDGWPVTGGPMSSLRPIAQIGWFRDLEREWYEIWRDIDAESEYPSDPDADDGAPLMARALLISGPGEDALLLDPRRVDPATGEWWCCRFSNGGGSGGGSPTFAAELSRIHDQFVGFHVSSGPGVDATEQAVDDAWRRALAGDVSSEEVLATAQRLNWRAQALCYQWEAFRPAAGWPTVMYLWWGSPTMTQDQAVRDPVVRHDLVPLWIVRMIEADYPNVEYQLAGTPGPIAGQGRAILRQLSEHGGITADFSYAPDFATAVGAARAHLPHDPDTAWRLVLAALPSWRPLAGHHLGPVGLCYDRDFRSVVSPRGRGTEILARPRGGTPLDPALALAVTGLAEVATPAVPGLPPTPTLLGHRAGTPVGAVSGFSPWTLELMLAVPRETWLSPADFAWAQDTAELPLACVALVHARTPAEALSLLPHRVATPVMSAAEARWWAAEQPWTRYGTSLEAGLAGDWAMLVELDGFQAGQHWRELSTGTAAVVLSWSGINAQLWCALDGELVRQVDPLRWEHETEPSQLAGWEHDLPKTGVRALPVCLALLQRLTGVALSQRDLLDPRDRIAVGVHPG